MEGFANCGGIERKIDSNILYEANENGGENLTYFCKNVNNYEATSPSPNSNGTFSVSDAVDKLGFGKFQIILSLFTGVCWMAESMELMTLSILPPALHCAFCVTSRQQAFLTTVVFIGMMLGAPFFGNLCDRFGRRLVLWVSIGLIFTFGFISAFSVDYYSLVFCRFCMGVAFGALPQSGAIGACFEVLLAMVLMPSLGWKWLLGFSSLPMLVYFLMCYWLPESVRYQAVSNQKEKATETLHKIAKANKEPMLVGTLVVDAIDAEERGRFKDLVRHDMRFTSILLWLIWISCAFCYNGVVFLSTEIFWQSDASGQTSLDSQLSKSELAYIDGVCDSTRESCQQLSKEDYLDLLWVTFSEFPAILVTIYLLDKIGRKKTMAIQFLLFSIAIFMFIFKIQGRILTTTLLFLGRGLVSGVYQALWVYTPEVYPTFMRAVGIGTCPCLSRIGAMLTPYIAQVLSKTSIPLAAACYGLVGIIAAWFSILLPIETMGKALAD